MKKNLFTIASILLVALLVSGCGNVMQPKINAGAEKTVSFAFPKVLDDAAVKHVYIRGFEVDENGVNHALQNLSSWATGDGYTTEAVQAEDGTWSTRVNFDATHTVRFVAWATKYNDNAQIVAEAAERAALDGETPTELTEAEATAAKVLTAAAKAAAILALGDDDAAADGDLYADFDAAEVAQAAAEAALGLPADAVAGTAWGDYNVQVAATETAYDGLFGIGADAAAHAYINYLAVRDAGGDTTATLATFNTLYDAINNAGIELALDAAVTAYNDEKYVNEPLALEALLGAQGDLAAADSDLADATTALADGIALVASTTAADDEAANVILVAANQEDLAAAIAAGEASGWRVAYTSQADVLYSTLSTLSVNMIVGKFAVGKTGPAGGVIYDFTAGVGAAADAYSELAPGDLAPMAWDNAMAAAAADETNQYDDWELPTTAELAAIMGFATSDVALFANDAEYWSSTETVGNSLFAEFSSVSYPTLAVTGPDDGLKTLARNVRLVRYW